LVSLFLGIRRKRILDGNRRRRRRKEK